MTFKCLTLDLQRPEKISGYHNQAITVNHTRSCTIHIMENSLVFHFSCLVATTAVAIIKQCYNPDYCQVKIKTNRKLFSDFKKYGILKTLSLNKYLKMILCLDPCFRMLKYSTETVPIIPISVTPQKMPCIVWQNCLLLTENGFLR